MKLTLTYVNRTQRTSKAGKPFTSVSIKATEYGDRYISGFGNKSNESWKAGDVVEVTSVVEKGQYLNFEMAKAPSGGQVEVMALSHKVDQLQSMLRSVIDHLSGKSLLNMTSAGKPVPDFHQVDDGLDQIDPDSIPF